MNRSVVVCLLCFFAVGPLAAKEKEYSPPMRWTGTERGKDDGNPAEGEGGERWRFDQVWPDNPLSYDNYKPLVWNGKGWVAEDNEHTQGGNPKATCEKGTVKLGSQGAWNDIEFQKLSSLSFVAPSSDTYEISVDIEFKAWTGEGSVEFLILHRDRSKKTLVPIKTMEFKKKGSETIEDLKIKLSKKDEIVFVPKYKAWHVGAGIELKNLVIKR